MLVHSRPCAPRLPYLSQLWCMVFTIHCLISPISAREHAKLIEGHKVHAAQAIHTSMVPASVQKVITMYIAWEVLGPSYRFNTTLREIQPRNHYQLAFTFDPTLTNKDLEKIIKHLPRRTSLRLDLISNGLTQPQNPKWDTHDRTLCYGAPIGPAIVNNNCEIISQKVQMPIKKSFKKKYVKSQKITLQKPLNTYDNMPKRILHIARSNNIIIEKIHWSMKHKPGRTVISHTSRALSELMLPGIKKSHNLTMDALWFASAQKLTQQHSINWSKASKIITQYMNKTHPNISKNMLMYDGSGLSAHNRVTVDGLNKLLKNIERNPKLYQWAIKAFPVAGYDGSLKKRFGRYKNELKNFDIVAKTGTFKRVRNLCGWVKSKSGAIVRFIWLENKSSPHYLRPPHATEDDIMRDIRSIFSRSTQGRRPT